MLLSNLLLPSERQLPIHFASGLFTFVHSSPHSFNSHSLKPDVSLAPKPKRLYLATASLASAQCIESGLTTTCSFSVNSGIAQTFIKPAGVARIIYTVTGGQGAGKFVMGTTYASGPSAIVTGTLDFTASNTVNTELTLAATVGYAGARSQSPSRALGGRGFGDGGAGGVNADVNAFSGSGGGAASAITIQNGQILVVAAGGGGFGNVFDGNTPVGPGSNIGDLTNDLLSSDYTGADGTDASAGGQASGGGGGGAPGGAASTQSRGNYGRSYYNPTFHGTDVVPTLQATEAQSTDGDGTNGYITVIFDTPPSPSAGNDRLRARRLRRNACPLGHATCGYGLFASCIDLATSLEYSVLAARKLADKLW